MRPECMRAGCTCITRYTNTPPQYTKRLATVLRRLHTALSTETVHSVTFSKRKLLPFVTE